MADRENQKNEWMRRAAGEEEEQEEYGLKRGRKQREWQGRRGKEDNWNAEKGIEMSEIDKTLENAQREKARELG